MEGIMEGVMIAVYLYNGAHVIIDDTVEEIDEMVTVVNIDTDEKIDNVNFMKLEMI